MENASKALIIAGAILLAILIIGLGVFIYNQASNTVGETGMDQVAVRQFNGQFEPYLNRDIGSSVVAALIDTVNSNNRTSDLQVYIDGIDNKSMLSLGHKYYTDPVYSNDGVLERIIITDRNQNQQNPDTPSDPGTVLDITAESFNQQFSGYIDATMPTGPVLATNSRTKNQMYELMDVVERSNRIYENHQVVLRYREEIINEYTSFITYVDWDMNDYICRITIEGYEGR